MKFKNMNLSEAELCSSIQDGKNLVVFLDMCQTLVDTTDIHFPDVKFANNGRYSVGLNEFKDSFINPTSVLNLIRLLQEAVNDGYKIHIVRIASWPVDEFYKFIQRHISGHIFLDGVDIAIHHDKELRYKGDLVRLVYNVSRKNKENAYIVFDDTVCCPDLNSKSNYFEFNPLWEGITFKSVVEACHKFDMQHGKINYFYKFLGKL